MQFIAAAILGALIQGASTLVGRVLMALGFGYVSYTGLTATLDYAQDQVESAFTEFPTQVLQVVDTLQIDNAMALIFSAIAVRFLLQGLQGGAFKRLVQK